MTAHRSRLGINEEQDSFPHRESISQNALGSRGNEYPLGETRPSTTHHRTGTPPVESGFTRFKLNNFNIKFLFFYSTPGFYFRFGVAR